MATAPGINVTIPTVGVKSPPNQTNVSFNAIFMFGSATSGPKNKITEIKSLKEFTDTFGTSGSTRSVDFLFANFAESPLMFVRCEDPGQTAPIQTGVLDKVHLTYALNQVPPLSSGMALAPEFFNRQTVATECSAILTALNTWCNNNDIMCIGDTMSDTDTIAKLTTYIGAVATGNQTALIYYPQIQYGIDKIPSSVLVVAKVFKHIASVKTMVSGGGSGWYRVDVGKPIVDLFSTSDINSIAALNVNPIRLLPIGGYTISDVLTLSGVQTFPQRMAECITKKALTTTELLFKLLDATGSGLTRIVGEVDIVMQQLDAFNCFSLGNPDMINEGLSPDDKYEILKPSFNSATSTLEMNLLVRFVNAIRIANIALQIYK